MAVLFAEQTNEFYFNAMVVVFRNQLKRYLETNKSGQFKLVGYILFACRNTPIMYLNIGQVIKIYKATTCLYKNISKGQYHLIDFV